MVTFAVSDVKPERSRLPTVGAAAYLAKLGWTSPEAHRVAATELVDAPPFHPLAYAVHLAFAQHRPLVLTPDAIWLCIAQSLATHIDDNAETLRPRLVRHTGVLQIVERCDDFVPGSADNDWPRAVDGIVAKLREHLGGRANAFVADFSTTTPLDRTASQIALMGAMRNYFDYGVLTMCGIPEITLTGTPDDWASMRRRLAAVREFDLTWWTEALDPVLAKLEATARGTIDHEFWRRLYKLENMSGGPYTSGWLTTLFAYLCSPPRRNTFPSYDRPHGSSYTLADFPAGRTRVPFTWQVVTQRRTLDLVGGLWGVTQDESGALGVASGWLVGPPTADGLVHLPWSRSAPPVTPNATVTAAPSPTPGTTCRASDFERTANAGQPTRMYPTRPDLDNLAALKHEASDEPITFLLSGCQLRSIDGIQHLRRLIDLDIHHAPFLENLAPLTAMTSVHWIGLSDCPLLTDLGPVLASLPNLRVLRLFDTPRITVADLLPLTHLRGLRTVLLQNCAALPDHLLGTYNTPMTIAALQAKLTQVA
jgi:hypothetical protein